VCCRNILNGYAEVFPQLLHHGFKSQENEQLNICPRVTFPLHTQIS